VTTTEIWDHIHAERAGVVEMLRQLDDAQWQAPSWCGEWHVNEVAGHILVAAEQTFGGFYAQLGAAGFRFHVYTDRGARRLGALSRGELAERLARRTTTTNHPPAPVAAMLGEIVTHGQDIRGALGLTHEYAPDALRRVSNDYVRTNLLIGTKRRVAGLALRATDVEWQHGSGEEVAGTLVMLISAMTGRKAAHGALSGPGLSILAGRA
jgi:uncharacterized protein (TIGR03083 family)